MGSYSYPADGQLRPHAPIFAGGVSYQYDAVGNLLSGGGRTPTWDAENRITAVGTTAFSYDAFGERLKKVSAQGTSLYPFGDDYEITNGVTTKYISVEGLGVIAKTVTGGVEAGTFWLHTDRLGSIQAITTTTGALAYRRTYRPYGETLSEAGTHTESRGWIDQRNDGETGLTYLHARYFDPKLGTFLSPDPLNPARPGVGRNRYSYGFGNPVNGTDRSGLLLDAGCWLWQGTVAWGGGREWFQYECVASSGGWGSGTTSGGSGTGGSGDGGRGVCTGTCKDKEEPKKEEPPVVTPPKTPSTPVIKRTICGLVPSGRVMGVSGGVGGTGGAEGGLELVLNYDSGQISGFAFGGVQGGWNGVFSGMLYSGFVYGLNGSNSNYSGGFTGFNGGAGLGVFGASSSGGLTGNLQGLVPNGTVKAGGVSVGASLVGAFSGGVTATQYTNPLQLGKNWAFALSPVDELIYDMRQVCK